MSGVIKDAGRGADNSTSIPQDAASHKRARILMAAKVLRAAQSDEEAADALEAAIELAKE